MAFTCQICFEEQDKRLALPKLTTGNGDVLRANDCQHPICQKCLATFVTTRVNDQFVFNMRCPFVGCTNELFEQDLTRLVEVDAITKNISERFAELRTRDYTARAKGLSEAMIEVEREGDLDQLQKIWQTTRLCPRCSLVIERSEGCNSFYCICGHHFDYSQAPRVFGNDVKNYGKVISTAKSLGLPLSEAEKYGGDTRSLGKEWSQGRAFAAHKAVSQISMDTGLDMDEAWQLYQQASSGDEGAQKRIRAARGREEAGSRVEEEEDDGEEVLYTLSWEDSPIQALSESLHKAQNATHICADIEEEKIVVGMEKNTTSEIARDDAVIGLQSCSAPVLLRASSWAHTSTRKKSRNVMGILR